MLQGLRNLFKSLRNLFIRRAPSRDLSELFEGELEITIEGIIAHNRIFEYEMIESHASGETRVVTFQEQVPLCTYVARAEERITGKYYSNVLKTTDAPWEILSFSRAKKKLVVRLVH